MPRHLGLEQTATDIKNWDQPVLSERMGVNPDLADYFFKLHAEIEPFEQDEGWEYVPTVLENARQRRRFKRAYMEKILSERRKDEGLLRRMKKMSGLA